MQVIGTRALARQIDDALALTQAFYTRLAERSDTVPAHQPELNLQCFSLADVSTEEAIIARHRRMTVNGAGWFSVSRWRDRLYFRAVLLSPATTIGQLDELVSFLADA